MQMKKSIRVCGLLIAMQLVCTSAFAGSMLRDSLLGSLSAEETKTFESTVAKTLNQAKDAEAVTWQGLGSQKKVRKQPLNGTFEPLRSTKNEGQDCRLLKASLSQGSQQEAWTMWFCKQQSGQWKVKNIQE